MSIIEHIKQLNDKIQLQVIITTAKNRLEELENQKGKVFLVLKGDSWYAVLPPDSENRVREKLLCYRLTPSQVLKQAKPKPPQQEDFEIPAEDALKLQRTNTQDVGWWEEMINGKEVRRFFLFHDYKVKEAEYKETYKLGNDTVALTYGLTIEAIKRLRYLEQLGYEIVLPD